MTNLTPIGNEADILRESKMPSQTGPRPVADRVPTPTPPQGSVDRIDIGLPQASNGVSSVPSDTLGEDYGMNSSNIEVKKPEVDPTLKPYSEPVSVKAKNNLPQPIKETSYRPFSYRLPVLNYILSVIFFITSAVALVYYIQLFSGLLKDVPIVDGAVSGIQVVGFSINLGSADFSAIAGHFAIATTLLLALTLLTTTRVILYISVFASLFGAAYWGYALSFAVSKTAFDTVFSGIGMYILLFYLFMFSIMLATFIHTVKSSMRI